ncbi:hypothetical protein C8J56DRAFT_1162622 [Mycena floridula]|nr:hypothetical protein C8J56DRAFT_1162622 [Mycena floridula]
MSTFLKFSVFTLASINLVAGFSLSIQAHAHDEINLGTIASTGDMVAWVSGDDRCTNHEIVGPSDTNYCSRPFGLNGQNELTVEGCGGTLWINLNFQFYGNCGVFSEPDFCGIHTVYHCG